MPSARIDDSDIMMIRHTFLSRIIGKMHMSVDKVPGTVLVQQAVEAPEAYVGKVLPVIDPIGRRMGDQDIHSLMAADPALQLLCAAQHLLLCILKITLAVPHRAADAGDPYPLKFINPAVDTGTAVRRRIQITVIMIAVDIQHRTHKKGRQKGQVLWGKIPAGYDQVYAIQPGWFKVIPQRRGRFI